MRDFRDAKAMAQTLREALGAKTITVSHSESLELVARMLGIADWNTLSAALPSEPRRAAAAPAAPVPAATCPALPIRDFVAFPTMTFPLFVGREKTRHALDRAFHGNREVVLVAQRDDAVDEPGSGDVHEIGVLARLIEHERLADGTMVGDKRMDGVTKIVVQAHRRVAIRRFTGEAGAFHAEIADVDEGPMVDALELVGRAADRFERHAAERDAGSPQAGSPAVRQIRDPGRLADVISQHMTLPVAAKQDLLATLDPVARLEKVVALMDG